MSVVVNYPAAGENKSSARTEFTPSVGTLQGISLNKAFWWRDGIHLHVEGIVKFNGSGGAGGLLEVGLPTIDGSQVQIDVDLLPGGSDDSNQGASLMGHADHFDNGAGWRALKTVFFTTTKVKFNSNVGLVLESEFAADDSLKYEYCVPIEGWS